MTAATVTAVLEILGLLIHPGRHRHSPELIRTFQHLCATNNFAFIPIVMIEHLS